MKAINRFFQSWYGLPIALSIWLVISLSNMYNAAQMSFWDAWFEWFSTAAFVFSCSGYLFFISYYNDRRLGALIRLTYAIYKARRDGTLKEFADEYIKDNPNG